MTPESRAREPLVSGRALTKNYPIRRTDASLRARSVGAAFGWTGALDEWSPLNDGLAILKGVDIDIYADETVAIVGSSGAGKSTLLHLLGGLDPPSSGEIRYRGSDLARMSHARLDEFRNRKVGFVFQFYYLFPDLTALENVLLPAMVASSTFGWFAGARRRYTERARELLRRVRLEPRLRHRPAEMSGGEQQRVAIARALLLEPEILFCDEPTGNLDRRTGDEVLELLWELKAKSGQTFVLVTHDHRLASRADRTIEMEDGRLKSVSAPASTTPVVPAEPGPAAVVPTAAAPPPAAGSGPAVSPGAAPTA